MLKSSWQLSGLDDTRELAVRLAGSLAVPLTSPMMLALCGPLGAGKTQLVRFLAEQLGAPLDLVTSPTYVLMQRYRGRVDILHLDFYRLNSVAQAWDLGLDEWLEEPSLTVIEWADKFPETWPDNYIRCDLVLSEEGSRWAHLEGVGERGVRWLRSCSNQAE